MLDSQPDPIATGAPTPTDVSDAGEQLELEAMPTMDDLDTLQIELDDIDNVLAELDAERPDRRAESRSEPNATLSPEPSPEAQQAS